MKLFWLVVASLFVAYFGWTKHHQANASGEGTRIVLTASQVEVVDGDTLRLAHGQRVRLSGINAREKYTPGAKETTEWLRRKLSTAFANQDEVWIKICQENPLDRYKRHLGTLMVNDQDVHLEMLGFGLVEVFYKAPCAADKVASYTKTMFTAYRNQLGLWSPSFVTQVESPSTVVEGIVDKVSHNSKGLFLSVSRGGRSRQVVVPAQVLGDGLADTGVSVWYTASGQAKPASWLGQKIWATGRPQTRKGTTSIRVELPSQIVLE